MIMTKIHTQIFILKEKLFVKMLLSLHHLPVPLVG